ncbi:MAG: Txe/YoeB family addiction module toxin [Bacteroidia bacterium]
MNIVFTEHAFEEYVSWQNRDKKVFKKLNALIKEISRTPFEGRGKPEPLKYELAGFWSRRIDLEHRLIYKVSDDQVLVYSCRYHYDK